MHFFGSLQKRSPFFSKTAYCSSARGEKKAVFSDLSRNAAFFPENNSELLRGLKRQILHFSNRFQPAGNGSKNEGFVFQDHGEARDYFREKRLHFWRDPKKQPFFRLPPQENVHFREKTAAFLERS